MAHRTLLDLVSEVAQISTRVCKGLSVCEEVEKAGGRQGQGLVRRQLDSVLWLGDNVIPNLGAQPTHTHSHSLTLSVDEESRTPQPVLCQCLSACRVRLAQPGAVVGFVWIEGLTSALSAGLIRGWATWASPDSSSPHGGLFPERGAARETETERTRVRVSRWSGTDSSQPNLGNGIGSPGHLLGRH